MAYFTLTTTAVNAIDNVTIYGNAIYEPIDVLRLITAHAKYPFSLKFSEKPVTEDAHDCLKNVLKKLDNMVLHKESVKWVAGEKKVLGELITDYKGMTQDNKYIYLDLSDDREFKYLKKDRSAMLAENRRVGEVMSFLFKNDCEFEYEGSRAILKILKDYFGHLEVSASRFYPEFRHKQVKLVVRGYEYTKVTETVEVEPIN